MATKRTIRKRPKKLVTKEAPVLTLKIVGPNVRKGRISVPDLVKICADAQTAVTRQAEALEGRKTAHPGPTTEAIRHECTLELIAIRESSTALDFGLAKPQLRLAFDEVKTFGAEVVEEVARAIQSLGNGQKQKDIDPGVLQSIYGLASVVETGHVSTFHWIALKSTGKAVDGSVTKKVRENAAAQLSGPQFKVVQIDGVLDMADFSRRERKCRIDPAIGSSVLCTFSPDDENAIQALLRQPVRVRGLAKIHTSGDRVESLAIQHIEPLPSLSLGRGNFFAGSGIEQLAAAQGNFPLKSVGSLGGLLADDEVDEFLSAIYEARRAV